MRRQEGERPSPRRGRLHFWAGVILLWLAVVYANYAVHFYLPLWTFLRGGR